MLKRTAATIGAGLSLAAGTALFAQSKPAVVSGPVGPSPYNVVRYWHKPFSEPGFAFGGNSGVFAESPDRIFIAQRGETRLPDPLPDSYAGFRRIDRDQRAQRHRPARHEEELSVHAGRGRQGARALVAMGLPVRRCQGPGAAPHSHQPVRSAAPRLGGRRDLQRHLRLFQRRQQAAEDARRERRARARTARISASRRTWRFSPTAES